MRTAKIEPDLRLRVALHRLARVFSRFFALLFPLCCVVGEVLSPSMSSSNALKQEIRNNLQLSKFRSKPVLNAK